MWSTCSLEESNRLKADEANQKKKGTYTGKRQHNFKPSGKCYFAFGNHTSGSGIYMFGNIVYREADFEKGRKYIVQTNRKKLSRKDVIEKEGKNSYSDNMEYFTDNITIRELTPEEYESLKKDKDYFKFPDCSKVRKDLMSDKNFSDFQQLNVYPGAEMCPQISPDGNILAFKDQSVSMVSRELSSLTWDKVLLTNLNDSNYVKSFGWQTDGSLIYSCGHYNKFKCFYIYKKKSTSNSPELIMKVDTVSYPDKMNFAKNATIACGEIDSYTKKIAVIDWKNQTTKIYVGQNPSISPDGTKILLAKNYKKTYLMPVNNPDNTKIIDEDYLENSSWSPDGKYIAYVVNTKDHKIFLRIANNEGTHIVSHKLSTYIDNINWGFDNYIYFNAGNSNDGYTCNRIKFNAK